MPPDPTLVVATYTQAADTFDELPFWHHYGRRTVELAGVRPGERVLDLFCGTGASALPAARAVGWRGGVYGVDLTPALLAVARRKAVSEGLFHARFDTRNVSMFRQPRQSWDVVLSVFGLFFAAEVPDLLQRASSWLRPGGRLVSTVWGEVVLAPGEKYFWDAVLAEDPSQVHISPASLLATPEALTAVHLEAGLPAPEIVRESWRMPLETPEAFWPVIMGTSNRGVFEALPEDARVRVKQTTIARLRAEGVDAVDMDALVAISRK